jgi:hypothetical protein
VLETLSASMLLLLEWVIQWGRKLKASKRTARRQDRKKHRTATPPVKRAPRANSALPLIVVTDVDGKQATPDAW